jgi:CRISPR/Cas system CSM-associated protein Csm3 (group 7 of RAMP superfamily)
MITSPYNFVPLNKKVVYPHWAKLISHDVPFENSLSGTIELQITANTPIFVKDGISAREAEKYKVDKIQNKPFLPNKFEDKYFIPGASIKGMIANVLEIISFGEIKNKVDDSTFSYREKRLKFKYKYSVVETILRSQNINENCQDFTSCIFGYSKKSTEKLENLKGRVHIGHAFALENTAKILPKHKKYVLGTPKASYYPNYISQDAYPNGIIKGIYKTFMHDTAVISGYKRYPVRKDYLPESNSTKDTDKVATIITPLEKGAHFTCNISYHNLRPEELGALISAITFHNSKDHFHSLGMGKPFGLGRISVEVKNLESFIPSLIMFENYMNYCLKDGSWETSEQIKELLVTSSLQEREETLIYPQLKNNITNKNDFKEAKDNNLSLLRYSKIVNNNALKFNSLSSETERQVCFSSWDKEKEIYNELLVDNLKQKYESKLEKKRRELIQVFEAKKKEVTGKLTDKLIELGEIKRKADKEKAKVEAEINGPSFIKVDTKDKTAFEKLKTEIELWAKTYYKINNIKNLEIENPNGYLIEIFRATLKNKLVDVANKGHRTQKEKLTAPFANNPFFRKIQTWVGPDLAKQWHDDLNKTE